jgi:hypothetical protein
VGGGYARNFFGEGGSTNSIEDRGQRERGSGGGSPLVRGSTQFENELNPYSNYLIRLLRMYIPRNWEFGSALAKRRISGGLIPLNPLGTPLVVYSAVANVAGCLAIRALHSSVVTECDVVMGQD